MEYSKDLDYTKIEIPKDVLASFAKAITPEAKSFYQSDVGKAYFERWEKSAHSTAKNNCV